MMTIHLNLESIMSVSGSLRVSRIEIGGCSIVVVKYCIINCHVVELRYGLTTGINLFLLDNG